MEASPPTVNPTRPPRPHPRPTQTPENKNTSITSQSDEPSNTVAALREAVFGEKRRTQPPVVLQKSKTKTPPKKQESGDLKAETQKSSVLRIAAVLEASKHNACSSAEIAMDKSAVTERPACVDTPADSREQHLEVRSTYPSQAPTPLARQTHSRNVNKLSTLNQQSEGSMHPSGAPYEVPQQGSKHHLSSVSTNTSNTSIQRKLSAESVKSHDGDEVMQNQPQGQIQPSLSTALQAALAKQILNKEQSGNHTHSQQPIIPPEEIRSSQPSSPVNTPSQQADSTLLERIRQRKAARANTSALADDSASRMSKDSSSTQNAPSYLSVRSSTDTKDQVHNTKPPLPDPSGSIENNGRGSRHSSLRRSSSNLSARRISGGSNQNLSSDDSCKVNTKGLSRSPTSVAQWMKDTRPSDRSDSHYHTSHKGLQRSPSNCSRRSNDESVSQLPPRSTIQGDTDNRQDVDINGTLNQTQKQFTQEHVLPTRNKTDTSSLVTLAKGNREDVNSLSSSSYAQDSMVFADFISRYSGSLPLAVCIQNAESVSSQRLVATRQCSNFNIHFIKHSKVVIIHDQSGGEYFSVPLNSNVRFGLIYDQQSESNTDHATYFETAGEIINLKQLPYVICATKQYDGGALEKSVAAGEILFVRGVKRAKAIGRGKCLKVNSINGDEKLLASKCSGRFTTAPHDCQLNLLVMIEHSIPLPQQAMLFSNTDVSSYLPQTMIDSPITLDRIQGESSAIMTPRDANKDESWMYDVSTEIKLWVKKLPLSAEEQEDLNAETNVFYTTFDPLYTQHYAEKSDDNGIALQHVLTVNVVSGKEKGGVHLYLPNSTMMPTETNSLIADINIDLSRGRTNILGDLEGPVVDETECNATYALHITEQRPIRPSKHLVEKGEITSITSANTEHSEESSYIPPTEDSDAEKGFEDDEPEEAYEEVMSALANPQEEPSDRPEPTGPRKIGKLVGMFKSVKHSLTKTPGGEADIDAPIEQASPSPEPEDYDQISFTEDAPADEDNVGGPIVLPPLPSTSQIAGRRPPQMAPPPPPLQQTATTSIALQRLMAAAKISPASSASVGEKEQEEQEGYQPVRADDEMFEDDESGYSDVRSLNIDIPTIIAAKQTSIAALLSKRKPALPLPAKEENPETLSHKLSVITQSSLPPDKTEPLAQSIQQSSSTHLSNGGSTEGDYMRLHSLYCGLKSQVTQLIDEVSVMKASIEQLSQMVEELMQAKDNKQDSVHPTKTQTLPRRKKSIKITNKPYH